MTTLPRFEGCEAVEKVHSGPISDVYEAVQQPLGRPVLVKALGTSILPSSPFAAALEREARVLAALSHPNIVAVHDFVRRDDRMWLVLEHVDGFTLEQVLETKQRVPRPAAIAVVRALARALDHAHSRRIIHRDVQPRNVLLARDGRVLLTNFSVASEERLPTAPELLDGGRQVSLAYQSPEQILGEPPDPRSDLFSLGALLFELVSGEPPFGGASDPNVAQRIRNDPLPPLARYGEANSALERVVSRCLQKLPVDRFQSAAELERALGELADAPADELAAVKEALSTAGLVQGPVAVAVKAPVPRESGSLWPTVIGMVLAGLALGVGFFVIRLGVLRSEKRGAAQAAQGKLELVPQRSGYLRVVAQPWAHVYVDGEQVDTTPFARPIPLSPGLHYVKLTHPSAPEERRSISIGAGESVVLDVSMKVPRSALSPTSAPSLSPSTSVPGFVAPPDDSSP